MANSADSDQLASSEAIWIYTVNAGYNYPGSAGLGLIRKNYSSRTILKALELFMNTSLEQFCI